MITNTTGLDSFLFAVIRKSRRIKSITIANPDSKEQINIVELEFVKGFVIASDGKRSNTQMFNNMTQAHKYYKKLSKWVYKKINQV